MASSPQYLIVAVLLLSGCGPGVSGFVLDAATERPVAGAVVEIRTSEWGRRDNQLVWDAEKVASATTDVNGRFSLDVDGGHGLRVLAPGQPVLDTSLCSRSPMIVRAGGPYVGLSADKRMEFHGAVPQSKRGRDAASYRAVSEGVEIRASGGAFSNRHDLQLLADGGLSFVAGTGAIPPPPPLPYERSVQLDLAADCGWLFVSNGSSPVLVILVRPLAWEQDPDRDPRWVMLYSSLAGR